METIGGSSILHVILKELRSINDRLSDIERQNSRQQYAPVAFAESRLFDLPDHLRRVYLAVVAKGECSANEASAQTGITREVACLHLNKLHAMGWMNKRKVSKTYLFSPVQKLAQEPKSAGEAQPFA